MTRLQDQAMIAVLHQRAWSAKVTDREIASELEDEKEAEAGSLRVIKELTPAQYIAPIRKIMRLGKDEHNRITVAGFMRGQSLLSTANFDQYALGQSAIRDEFYKAVDRFVDFYPNILTAAPARLKKAYRSSDFPTVDQIRGYFEYHNDFLPIPVTDDWRLEGINTETAELMREQAEAQVKATYEAATKEVFERAKAVLENIANQCRNYGSEKGASPLRDATVKNLKDMAELVCSMNIAQDPLLDEVGREMVREFSTVLPADLRKSDQMRQDIASVADRILARIATRE